MAQPQPPSNSGKGDGMMSASATLHNDQDFGMPPPPYPGTERDQQPQGFPDHPRIPAPVGWGAYPPPPPPPQNQPPYQYGSTTTVTVQPAQLVQPGTRVVIVSGGCPRCHVGSLIDDFDCCAIFLAIFFFPIGILCCLAMRQKRCTNCGATF
ncbi:brain protein I3 [Folsomia candida]|uniref:Membrane protein BRI3 n=1 Tax=Folsomia candida TaxID=158441 RepID=A0A226E2I7_FOLCA|nr:brain protein I3 [Folsomia candida]OXA51244.1 Brain protein I3 [Folsomia candida]